MIKHLACIMDGNRRWAKKRNLMPWDGHSEGVKTVKKVVGYCIDKKIEYLTLYLFSIENFKRSAEEKKYLFSVIAQQAEQEVPEYNAKGIKIRFIGQRDLFPDSVIQMCNRVEEQTAHNTNLTLNLLFCYGGQQEIVAGVQKCVQAAQDGELDASQLNVDTLKSYLWTGDVPDPDIIIRTGGASRLSNCLLFYAAYSQLYFLDTLWPDLSSEQLDQIIVEFNGGERNFGK
ncbi:MAG TPA: polyprenyl diphosphate synthase [Candidatus Babeliales bacterium]|nr:polyprenyl diphosphate synthase [Candidatus Babeliales bacterium]